MITRLLAQQLKKNKYLILPSSMPEYSVFIRPESSAVLYLHIIDYTRNLHISNEEYQEIKTSLVTETKEQYGMDGHIMTLVFYDDIEKAKRLVGEEYFCWFIDRNTGELRTEPYQVEDFYGLKSELEQYLINCRSLIECGDMKELEKALATEESSTYKPPKRKPAPASIMLLVLNLIMFSTRAVIGQPFIDATGMSAQMIDQGEIYRFLTAMFMHSNVEHLLSNMLVLYFLGEMMEHVVGTSKVAIIYMISGLIGNVVSYGYCEVFEKTYLSVGASGAVFGLIGAVIALILYKYENFQIPVPRMVLLIAFSIYSSFAEPNIDFAAHLGGLVVGTLLALVLFRKKGGSKVEG